MQQRTVDLGEVQIVTTDQGQGVPVWLMHGNPDCRRSWQPVIDALDVDCRIIAPDFPGFGDSPEPPAEFDFLPASQATLWNRFADAIGLDRPAVVVVHDFGGPWLLPWVAAHPKRVGALLFSNTLFQTDYRWHFWARVWQTRGLGELAFAIGPRWLWRWEMRRGSAALPLSYVDQVYDRLTPSMQRTILRTYRAFSHMPTAVGRWEEQLLRVTAQLPKRVIWGDRDPYIGRPFSERYGVPAEHWPEAGHWAYLEQPQRFAEDLGQLVRKTSAT